MSSHKNKSLKRNKGRKASQFQHGHPAFYRRPVAEVAFPDCKTVAEQSSLTSSRLSSSELADVMSATSSSQSEDPGIMNYRLRPEKEKNYTYKETKTYTSVHRKSYSDNENIVVNIQKLEELFGLFSQHQCEASGSVNIDIAERQGLCVSIIVKCNNCGFETPKTGLFTKIKSQRGPEAGCINHMMLMPVLKSRIGLKDLNFTLSCLNVRAPDIRGLQRKLNKLTDRTEELNKQQMIQNQQYVKKIQTLAGLSNQSDTEYDVSYSRRPHQGCERAMQSFAPLIEQTTTRHLPIAIETANKLCTKPNCEHNTSSCKRNYNPNESIQSSEPKLLKRNLDTVHGQNIIKIRSVTTDASAQIAKALREYNISENYSVRHFKCFIHRMRSLHKQIKNLNLNSISKEYDKTVFSQKLASCLRARVGLELTRYRKRFIQEQQYVKHARICITNILNCFQGKHTECRKKSMVCEAHLSTYNTKFLPYGKHIMLSATDIDKIDRVLSKYLSPECLKDMARLKNTNQCESIHSQLFRCAPKHTVWSRNFTGLCHSVAHSASLGTGTSLLKTVQVLGLPVSREDPFYLHMSKVDSATRFHGRRQASLKYKTFRYLRRKQKNNRKLFQLSLYGTDHQLDTEHSYGIYPSD